MNSYKLHSKQLKVVYEDKVSKIGQLGTLTCSPASQDSGTKLFFSNTNSCELVCRLNPCKCQNSPCLSGKYRIKTHFLPKCDLCSLSSRCHNYNMGTYMYLLT